MQKKNNIDRGYRMMGVERMAILCGWGWGGVWVGAPCSFWDFSFPTRD